MKKYKWNKAKFAINIIKLEIMALTALVFDSIFLYAFFR